MATLHWVEKTKVSVETAMKTVGFNIRGDRQKDDYYATPPEATDALLSVESFEGNIFEPCCGEGHISKRLTFLEGVAREEFFQRHPPVRVWVFSRRLSLLKDGQSYKGGMMCLAWFVWETGSTKPPQIGWI